MPWIKDGVEYSESQVRARHPRTSFPKEAEHWHLEDKEFGYTWQEPTPPTPPSAKELAGQGARDLEEAEDAADKAGVFDLSRTEFLAKIDKMLQTPEGTQRLIKMMARIVKKVN